MSTKHILLSSAASAAKLFGIGTAAAGNDPAPAAETIITPPPAIVTPPDAQVLTPPAASEEETGPEYVLLSDAQKAVEAATSTGRVQGAKDERARTAAVMGSAPGKADPGMAVWMLENNPDAAADAIVGKMASMPASAAPLASTAITIPLNQTPKLEVGPNAPGASMAGGEADSSEADKMIAESQKKIAASLGSSGAGALSGH